MKRLFLAVNIPYSDSIKDVVEDWHDVLFFERVSWVNKDNIHTTLIFLGDTAAENVPVICDEMREIADDFNCFECDIKSAGMFKNSRGATLWLGLKNIDELTALQKRIVERLAEKGVEFDKKAFKPHLTLGRIKELRDKFLVDELIREYKKASVETIEVNEFVLMESQLKQEGPEYKEIERFNLTQNVNA